MAAKGIVASTPRPRRGKTPVNAGSFDANENKGVNKSSELEGITPTNAGSFDTQANEGVYEPHGNVHETQRAYDGDAYDRPSVTFLEEANIYAEIDMADLTRNSILLVSQPYPIISEEYVDLSGGLEYAQLFAVYNEATDLVGELDSASLIVVTSFASYDMLAESSDVFGELESGSLVVVTSYNSYTLTPEYNVDMSGDLDSASLVVVSTYANYDNPPESTDLFGDFVEGSLT